MLSITDLSLSINEEKILFSNISISFLPSAIIWLKGKNGSGKTSLLKLIAGIMPTKKNSIRYGYKQIDISEVRKPYCTYIGHNLGIKNELTVLENLKIWASLYNSYELIDAAIMYFNLQELVNKKCYQLSAGNKKKLAMAKLIICQSKIWLLDEIDTNLDNANQQLLLNLIITHANNNGIVFIATHNYFPITSAEILNLDEYTNNEENKNNTEYCLA